MVESIEANHWVAAYPQAQREEFSPEQALRNKLFVPEFMKQDNTIDCLPCSLGLVTWSKRQTWEERFYQGVVPAQAVYALDREELSVDSPSVIDDFVLRPALLWHMRNALQYLVESGYAIRKRNNQIIIFGRDCKQGYVIIQKTPAKYRGCEIYHAEPYLFWMGSAEDELKELELLPELDIASLPANALIGAEAKDGFSQERRRLCNFSEFFQTARQTFLSRR